MKDPKDKQTGDLLQSSAAKRQAAYKARKLEQGYKRATVWIHEADWQAGFDAGEAGRLASPMPEGIDALSWLSGWIEGDAKRQGFEYSKGAK